MTRARPPKLPPVPARLVLLPDMPNAQGEPRAGLMLPLPPNPTSRRSALAIFESIGAALAEKARLEGGTNAHP